MLPLAHHFMHQHFTSISSVWIRRLNKSTTATTYGLGNSDAEYTHSQLERVDAVASLKLINNGNNRYYHSNYKRVGILLLKFVMGDAYKERTGVISLEAKDITCWS